MLLGSMSTSMVVVVESRRRKRFGRARLRSSAEMAWVQQMMGKKVQGVDLPPGSGYVVVAWRH